MAFELGNQFTCSHGYWKGKAGDSQVAVCPESTKVSVQFFLHEWNERSGELGPGLCVKIKDL